MIDKKQLLGGVAIAVALLGVSAATGKLDLSKLTGGGTSDDTPSFSRLPPKVADEPAQSSDAQLPAQEDVLASIAGENHGDAYINDLVGPSQGNTEVPVETAGAAVALPDERPMPADVKLASTDPASMVLNGTTFASTPVVASPAGVTAAPVAIENGPQLPKLPVPIVVAASGASVTPSAGPLPPGVASTAVPTESASVPAVVSTPPSAGESSSASVSSVPADVAASAAGGEFNTEVITSLPATATGSDLLALQTQLAVLEKHQKIAAGQEAIAESRLNAAKALYEISRIGKPTAEQLAAQRAADQKKVVAVVAASPASTVLNSVKLLSTTRANGMIGATITLNGKLIDVKQGSLVQGYLVEKVTDNSLTLAGEGQSKTVWID